MEGIAESRLVTVDEYTELAVEPTLENLDPSSMPPLLYEDRRDRDEDQLTMNLFSKGEIMRINSSVVIGRLTAGEHVHLDEVSPLTHGPETVATVRQYHRHGMFAITDRNISTH